jgi:hypothetical protein
VDAEDRPPAPGPGSGAGAPEQVARLWDLHNGREPAEHVISA